MKQNRGYCALFASLLAVLIALQFAPPAWSADVGSRLRCTVTDESKAFVSGARLTLTDANNKFTAEGTSNDHGEYTFINLPPATYRLKVERDGFSPKLADDITLDLNEVRVLNITLGVGEERVLVAKDRLTAEQITELEEATKRPAWCPPPVSRAAGCGNGTEFRGRPSGP